MKALLAGELTKVGRDFASKQRQLGYSKTQSQLLKGIAVDLTLTDNLVPSVLVRS